MATRKQAVEMAAALGAQVSDDRIGVDEYCGEIVVTAPGNLCWSCSGVHQIVICYGSDRLKGDVWSELIEDMRAGLSECQQGADCDWCGETAD